MANQAPSGLKLATDANGLPSIQNSAGQTIVQGRVLPFSLTSGQNKTISVKEGDTLTVKGNSAAGTVQRLDSSNNVIQTWTVSSGTLAPIGPYSGTSQFLITCTAGSIDGTVGDAVLGMVSGNYSPEAFGAVGNNSVDDTAALQQFLSQGGQLRLTSGKIYKITDTLMLRSGATILEMNGATLNASFGTNYGKSLITNIKGTDPMTEVSTQFTIRNGRITGNCVGVNLTFTTDNPNAGLKLIMEDIYYNSNDGNRRAGTSLFVADHVDFSSFQRIDIWNADLGFSLGSEPPHRGTTQCELNLIGLHMVNSAGRFQGVDLAKCTQVDVSRCNNGFVFVSSNKRMEFNSCHVEGIGYPQTPTYGPAYSLPSARVPASSAGTGFYFVDAAQSEAIELNKCSTQDLSGNLQSGAVGVGTGVCGLYIGRCDNYLIQSVTMNDCSFNSTSEGAVGFLAFVNRGKFAWNGRFPFTGDQVSLTTTGQGYMDMIINDNFDQISESINLLQGNTPLSLFNGAASGGPTMVEAAQDNSRVTGGTLMTFQGPYELFKTVILPAGWSTIDLTGFRTSGGAFAYVEQTGSPFTSLLQVSFNGLNDKYRRWRLSFYNPNPGNISFKIGFKSTNVTAGADVLSIANNMALYAGFAQDLPPQTLVDVVSVLPTASNRWLNRSVIVRVTGSADAVWRCLNNASNTPVWVAA